MVFGVFDHFHPGHEYFLTAAAEKCDQLIVAVTPDEVAAKLKGKLPDHGFATRVAGIRAFDARFTVIAGDAEIGSWNVLSVYAPDMIFLGYDQQGIARELDRLEWPYAFLDSHHPDKFKSSLMKARDVPP